MSVKIFTASSDVGTGSSSRFFSRDVSARGMTMTQLVGVSPLSRMGITFRTPSGNRWKSSSRGTARAFGMILAAARGAAADLAAYTSLPLPPSPIFSPSVTPEEWGPVDDLLRGWLRRAREGQHSHHEAGKLFRLANYWLAVPVIVITTGLGAVELCDNHYHAVRGSKGVVRST